MKTKSQKERKKNEKPQWLRQEIKQIHRLSSRMTEL